MRRSLAFAAVLFTATAAARTVDLSRAVVVVHTGQLPAAEATAARMFVEEVEKRTGIHLVTTTRPTSGQAAIIIETDATLAGKPDGYHVFLDPTARFFPA